MRSYSYLRRPVQMVRFISFCLACFFLLSLCSSRVRAQEPLSRAAANASTTSTSASGSITGRVTGDDGRPISDALVYAHGAYATTTTRAGTSDASGRFQINDLAPGLYILRAAASGYVGLPDENSNPWETKYYRPGESVQLTLVKGGVVTGTVSSASGEPLIAMVVRAVRVRDAQGRRVPLNAAYSGTPRMTDDRGVYRIFGLQPGTYMVIAGGSVPYLGMFNPYENDSPTYYPSSTRDTATEVTVRSGEEAAGIDIRYRAERGHTISGTVSGSIDPSGRVAIAVTLTRAPSGMFESISYVMDPFKRVFSLDGVSDGEYELVAQGNMGRSEMVVSAPRRVTVRGADVTGVELALAPMSSIAGRVTLEPAKDETCKASSGGMAETLLLARREEAGRDGIQMPSFSTGGNFPSAEGDFVIRNLAAGDFRLTVRPPGDDWYVRAIALPSSSTVATTTGAAKTTASKATSPRGTLRLKMSERLSGVAVNLAQGAASVRGRVLSSIETAQLPPNLRAYLVPSERERADDILRYAEANVAADGSFSLTNIAPGSYRFVLRPAPETDTFLRAPRMLAWDEEARAALRREAEAGKLLLELKPCQRVSDYKLDYTAK